MRFPGPGPGRARPRMPRRGNWIWLVSSAITVITLTGVALRWPVAGCVPAPAGGRPGSSAASTVSAGPAGAGSSGAARTGPPGAPLGAGRPVAAITAGHAVFYDPDGAVGSCSLGPFPAPGWYASLPAASYDGGRACGSYLTVQGPAGTVLAEVVDVCTECATGTIDLSRAAFSRLAGLRAGTVPVRYWPASDPPLAGPLALRVAVTGGSIPLAVQVLNHGNRLASVALQAGREGRWVKLVPEPDGYWAWRRVRADGAVPRVTSVRVTDVAGHRAVLTGLPLDPGRAAGPPLRTRAWMYQPGEGRGATAASARPAPAPSGRPRAAGHRAGDRAAGPRAPLRADDSPTPNRLMAGSIRLNPRVVAAIRQQFCAAAKRESTAYADGQVSAPGPRIGLWRRYAFRYYRRHHLPGFPRAASGAGTHNS